MWRVSFNFGHCPLVGEKASLRINLMVLVTAYETSAFKSVGRFDVISWSLSFCRLPDTRDSYPLCGNVSMVAVQHVYLDFSLFVVNPPESVGAPLSLSPCKGLASFLSVRVLIPFSHNLSEWVFVFCLTTSPKLLSRDLPPNCPRRVTTAPAKASGLSAAGQQQQRRTTKPLPCCVTCFQKLHNGLFWIESEFFQRKFHAARLFWIHTSARHNRPPASAASLA